MQASSASPTTPRADSDTEAPGRYNMDRILKTHYIDDADGNIDRGNRPPPPPAPKAKKTPVRKPTSSSSKKSTSAQEESPTLRKSSRVTAGIKRPALTDTANAAGHEQQPATKKAKQSVTSTTASNIPAVTVQKHTGRFATIGSQLKRSKKIEKQPATKNNEEATPLDNGGDADIEDAEESEEVESTNKIKDKKIMPKAFVGESNAMGSSLQKPDDAPNDEHWKCANRNCNSGQTWHNRDKFGRKVISNFFGRNKKETNLIHPDVWHNYCRKDYQRSTYRVNTLSPEEKCKFYIENIEMQLIRIKLWRPQAMFKVQLSKGASIRLATYYKELTKNGNNISKAKNAVTKTPGLNTKGKEKPLSLEDAFPIEYLQQFDDDFCSKEDDQSFDDINNIMAWIKELVEHDRITSMPPMEFLINKQTDDEEVIDPEYNYERWTAHTDGTKFIKPNGSDAGDAAQAEQGASDSEETELNSDGAELQEEELYGLTDDESSEDEESEPDLPKTPTPPNKYKLTPAYPGARPLSSTFGAVKGSGLVSKRKREVIDEDSEESIEGTPSKKPNLGNA